MNYPPSRVISVRAIEDIMQIQKLMDLTPDSKSFNMGKDKSQERIFFSVLKHDMCTPDAANNRLNNIIKKCDIENTFKCTDKTCKRLENNGWEGVCEFSKFVNPDVVVLENFGIIENASSESDMKCWSSDSDITILRMKKEYRNELSNRVDWEEQRNLEDDESISSTDLDWESHSLINLANVSSQEKNVQEVLTPFTIWSRSKNDTRNSSMIFVENSNSTTVTTPEVRLTVEDDTDISKEIVKRKLKIRNKKIGHFFRSTFACFVKGKSSN